MGGKWDPALVVGIERADNGTWWVTLDGKRVSDHRDHEAARIASLRHLGINARRAGE